jgi:hypothetical protein
VILDQLAALWDQLLKIADAFVIPDWAGLIALLPVFLVVLLIGPAIAIALVAWFVYVVRRPRAKVRIDDGPRRVEVALDGSAHYPVGLPYCVRDGLVYASGTTRCRECGDDLAVICPMCGLGRSAGLTTCGNCGLVLRIEERTRVMRPAGPPPGGAAVA